MNAALVGAGGVFGSLARFLLSALYNPSFPGFPWGTLLCNLVGCLLIGWLSGWERLALRFPRLRLALTTGFLGGLTTFSAFSLETVQMLRHRHAAEAILYVAFSCLGGLMAARAGHDVSRSLNGRRRG